MRCHVKGISDLFADSHKNATNAGEREQSMKPTQQSLATAGFEIHRKRTRRDEFLAQMDQVVPWTKLCALIEQVYPKGEGAGRPTVGSERMLRIYFLQQWFNLSDPAVEESLYDSVSMRQFVGIDLGREAAPDETTVCKAGMSCMRARRDLGFDSHSAIVSGR
jgi:hypothetical protein